MLRNFSATAPFLAFASLTFCAADKGGESGDSGDGDNKPAADVSTLPKAKAQIDILNGQITTLTTSRDEAVSAKTKAEQERDQANKVMGDTAKERAAARTSLGVEQGRVTTLTTDLATANTNLTAAKTNVDRLERLCGVKGLNPKDVPNAANDENTSSGAALYAQYEALSGGDKTAFLRKHGPALEAYGNSLRRNAR